MRQGRSDEGSGRSTRWGLPLSLGLYGLCAASMAGACLYFFLAYVPGRRAAAVNEWRQEMVVRADLRKMTLDNWVAGGMADADILAAYPTPRALIAGGAGAPTASPDADAAAHLREVAERFARMRGYLRFVLLDANLRIVVGVGAAAQLERPDLQTAAEVMAQRRTMVDFHRYADGRVAVVFLARVDLGTASRTGGGVVLLEADPKKWLYPYLAMRPMATASAETVLLRREGDDIVYLSPLRHNPAPPLTFRRPANVTGFAALAAVEGREGFAEYVDYRNEPVFAAVVRLDRAPWGLVVKVDQRDALATYRQEIRRTGAAAVAAFVAFWALAFLVVLAWRRRAEAALREGEERYRATLYSIGDAVITTDQGGRVRQMNPVAEILTAWTEVDAVGKHLDEVFRIVNEHTHAVVESPVARVLREGQVVGLANHTLLIGKDGNEHPIADSGAPIRNEKGETTGVVLVFRDQTEERAALRSLQESERQYRTLAESLPHLVWTCRADGPCDYLSPRWVDYTGIPEADQLDYGWLERLHPDDRERVIAEWGEGVPRGGVFDIEFRIRRADGAYRWFKTRAIPFRDNDGRVVKWFGSNTDVDDYKRVHESLRESEERARTTLNSIGDAVIATDEGGRVRQMNPVAEKLTGWTESHASGRPLYEVFRIVNEETQAVVESPVARVLREGHVVGIANHTVLIGKDGKEHPIADSGAPIRNEKGETTGVVLVFRDQTEERAAQNVLKRSEAFNRTIVESIPQQLFLKDRNGVYLAVNQPYAASLGCRPEQLVAKTTSLSTRPSWPRSIGRTTERSWNRGRSKTWRRDTSPRERNTGSTR